MWTPNEDELLLRLLSTKGPSWTVIATHFPHRTIPSLRNRWRRIDMGQKHPSASKCSHCGQPRRGHTCWSKMRAALTDEERMAIAAELGFELALE